MEGLAPAAINSWHMTYTPTSEGCGGHDKDELSCSDAVLLLQDTLNTKLWQ